ncbi:glycosyl transferase [Caproiciproducens sp. NJN-50]|uniref:glycosyltransferase WbsX family protein n=1 Tax=Acutalibacteraceae TaxID=3082771 RepID=UPI000FFE0C8F|nr:MULTISPECIES: glycoside hydrolase family 99-like domain-containing protein [Acutalibacteraceae]QAT50109.1 glycosyl transferase [Caproiciproducens sp. NJN-50]
MSELAKSDSALQFIAFYLPQFHQIKENDEWWGKGFTEWTNTRKAVPLFQGHRQPREPLNHNYYDLTDIKALKWQAELMKKYHVHGLCFYHYWFGGKMLLEKPMELLLEHKEIDMNFCVSWANEPWTRNWDGGSREILMPQIYGGPEEWKKHFDYLLPFFKDKRYIKINNRPLIALYLSAHIENGKAMADYWQKLAKENGFDGLFIAETLNAIQGSLYMENSDACIEFEPCVTLFGGYTPWSQHRFYKTLHLFQFDEVWKKILERKSTYGNREKFCGAFTDWDNTSRVGMRGSVCIGSTPEGFKKHLGDLAKKCIAEGNDRFIFINAWNEWAESAYLEPDKDNGYQYLEAVRDVYENIILRTEAQNL